LPREQVGAVTSRSEVSPPTVNLMSPKAPLRRRQRPPPHLPDQSSRPPSQIAGRRSGRSGCARVTGRRAQHSANGPFGRAVVERNPRAPEVDRGSACLNGGGLRPCEVILTSTANTSRPVWTPTPKVWTASATAALTPSALSSRGPGGLQTSTDRFKPWTLTCETPASGCRPRVSRASVKAS
jgi:hypothetical protein